MSEMKPVAYLVEVSDGGRFLVHNDQSMSGKASENAHELYTADQLSKAVAERDLIIRDLRKELNERRYGRSAAK